MRLIINLHDIPSHSFSRDDYAAVVLGVGETLAHSSENDGLLYNGDGVVVGSWSFSGDE
jgi:hypothetical protein